MSLLEDSRFELELEEEILVVSNLLVAVSKASGRNVGVNRFRFCLGVDSVVWLDSVLID